MAPKHPFSIRRCRAAEAARVLALWRAADATPSVTDSLANVRRVVAGRATVLLVAEMEGAMIGTIIGSFDGWRGHIYRLAVHPAYRRRGIARALAEAAVVCLSRRGAVRITAIVEHEHDWAMHFWNAVGFAEDRRTVRFLRTLDVDR